eukprot:s2503_g5.t1
MLTFTSVLFLSLPVGIIGHEFTRSWQIRGQVLLKNRIRRCMLKWGYSSKDLRLLIEYVDVNCDGMLALTESGQKHIEFLELMRQMRIGISAQSAIDLFMAFDDDSNGYIDYDEFLRQIFPEEYVKDTVDSQILYSYGEKLPQAPVTPPETILESPEIMLTPAESRLRTSYGSVTSRLPMFPSRWSPSEVRTTEGEALDLSHFESALELILLREGFSRKEYDEFQMLYNMSNRDREVQVAELKVMLHWLGFSASHMAPQLASQVDRDGSGSLNFLEFPGCTWWLIGYMGQLLG